MSRPDDWKPASPALPGWWAVRVRVPDGLEDEAVERLACGSLGVETDFVPGADVEVSIFFSSEQNALVAAAAAAIWLEARGLATAGGPPTAVAVRDDQWVERYQRSLRPFPLGCRFRVFPSGRADGAADRIPLLLVPGRAFGTGEHATTRMCAEALERRVEHGSRWIDLGTGSGILAMVAVHCGATRVEAVDIDPEAVAVAREVLSANGLGRRVDVRVGSLSTVAAGRVDGIVCNIHPPYFEREGAALVTAGSPGGWIVASGFGAQDAAPVRHALVRAGAREVHRADEGEWTALVFRAPGGV